MQGKEEEEYYDKEKDDDDDLQRRIGELETKMHEFEKILRQLRDAFAKFYEDQRRRERVL